MDAFIRLIFWFKLHGIGFSCQHRYDEVVGLGQNDTAAGPGFTFTLLPHPQPPTRHSRWLCVGLAGQKCVRGIRDKSVPRLGGCRVEEPCRPCRREVRKPLREKGHHTLEIFSFQGRVWTASWVGLSERYQERLDRVRSILLTED
jgi:hypothetical protein